MSEGDVLPIPVPPDRNPPELTRGPLVLGVILGVIFGASSIYLTLKVGLTVSASIPVASNSPAANASSSSTAPPFARSSRE